MLTTSDASCKLVTRCYSDTQRAIAIQFQVYVIAAAQYGVHNPSRSSWGESLAFDPWGRQLGRLRSVEDDTPADGVYADGGEFFICEVDTESIQ